MSYEFLPAPAPDSFMVAGIGRGAASAVTLMRTLGIENGKFIVYRPGSDALHDWISEVQRALNNRKLLFIVAGPGGSSAITAAAEVSAVARKLSVPTVGIVTIPFRFEGDDRIRKALGNLNSFKQSVDFLIVIPMDILKVPGNMLSQQDLFRKADRMIHLTVKSITDVLTIPGYVCVDLNDFFEIMMNCDYGFVTTGETNPGERGMVAVKRALSSPMMIPENASLTSHILFHLVSGPDDITIDEIVEIVHFLKDYFACKTDIIWGFHYDPSLGDKIRFTMVGAGARKFRFPGIDFSTYS